MGNLKVAVRLQPRASKPGIVGWEAGALKVKVNAPPVDGKANEALILLLSEAFKVPKSRLAVVQGQTSRNKIVEFLNISEAQTREIKGYGA